MSRHLGGVMAVQLLVHRCRGKRQPGVLLLMLFFPSLQHILVAPIFLPPLQTGVLVNFGNCALMNLVFSYANDISVMNERKLETLLDLGTMSKKKISIKKVLLMFGG